MFILNIKICTNQFARGAEWKIHTPLKTSNHWMFEIEWSNVDRGQFARTSAFPTSMKWNISENWWCTHAYCADCADCTRPVAIYHFQSRVLNPSAAGPSSAILLRNCGRPIRLNLHALRTPQPNCRKMNDSKAGTHKSHFTPTYKIHRKHISAFQLMRILYSYVCKYICESITTPSIALSLFITFIRDRSRVVIYWWLVSVSTLWTISIWLLV